MAELKHSKAQLKTKPHFLYNKNNNLSLDLRRAAWKVINSETEVTGLYCCHKEGRIHCGRVPGLYAIVDA